MLYVFAATLPNRVVPICLEKCNIPEVLRYVYVLPYYKTETRPWFWQRLFKAFSGDSEVEEQRAKTSVHLPDIVLETAVQKMNSLWTYLYQQLIHCARTNTAHCQTIVTSAQEF